MKQVKNISLLLLSALMATSCSNEEVPDTPINNELVELGVTAGVSLTKSAIHANTHDDFTSIAVFASGEGYSDENENNAAIYTKSGDSWENKAEKKIMLSNEEATIYAIYPAKNSSNTDWTVTDFPTTPTIPVAVFQGNDSGKKTESAITVPSSTTSTANDTPAEILSAPGEIDYMYGVDGSSTNVSGSNLAKASNKKEGEPESVVDKSKIELKMKHALAMVSFRIYNDGTYSGKGQLTEITLSNVSDKKLNAGSSSTMNISTGAITEGDGDAAIYTRVIKGQSDAYYTLGKVTSATPSDPKGKDNIKAAAAKFSILVFPLPTASSVKASTIQVTFKIDGVEHTVPLGTDQTDVNFAAGTNSLYTAVLSGKGLSITSVAVADWGETEVSGDLGVD